MFSCWSFSVIPLHQILSRWVHPYLFMGLNTSSRGKNCCSHIKLPHEVLAPCNSCLLVVLDNQAPVHSSLVDEPFKLKSYLELCQFAQRSSSQELQDGKCHFYWNWPENPTMTLVSMDGILLEVRNRKKGCRAWGLIATTSHDWTLSMLLF
jgi:hypothetical protein